MRSPTLWRVSVALTTLLVSALAPLRAAEPTDADPPKSGRPADYLHLEIKDHGQKKTISGYAAVRYIYDHRDYNNTARYGYLQLWNNIQQPDVLALVATAFEKQGKKDEATVFTTLTLRALEQASKDEVARYRAGAEQRLKRVNGAFEQLRAQYVARAARQPFTSPDQVSDLWMTQVKSDLHSLHGLYAWKLIDGRHDAKPDWIHNRQGTMHPSGMKFCEEVDQRKGVLFGIPLREGHVDEAGHASRPTRVTMPNLGHGRFLRLGTKGYGFSFVLRVTCGQQELLKQAIPTDPWTDLKIDVGEAAAAAAAGAEVLLELIVPADQRWSEGAWFDYLDFFPN